MWHGVTLAHFASEAQVCNSVDCVCAQPLLSSQVMSPVISWEEEQAGTGSCRHHRRPKPLALRCHPHKAWLSLSVPPKPKSHCRGTGDTEVFIFAFLPESPTIWGRDMSKHLGLAEVQKVKGQMPMPTHGHQPGGSVSHPAHHLRYTKVHVALSSS